MAFQLDGKIALVTAASQGMGYASALSLANAGATVVICARNGETLNVAAETIRAESGSRIIPLVADLESPAAIDGLFEQIAEAVGPIDFLVTNVGHPKTGHFEQLDMADWQGGFDGILGPTIQLIQGVLPTMKARGTGRIVNISSHAVLEPGSKYLVSAVFRTALASLFKALSFEIGPHGICINTICPGLVRTPLGMSVIEGRAAALGISPEEAEEKLAQRNALGRIAEPKYIGDVVTFLCSPAAGHITGEILSVDGGRKRGL